MKPKVITITINPRKGESSPNFKLEAEGMERYEILGILTLALSGIERECFGEIQKP